MDLSGLAVEAYLQAKLLQLLGVEAIHPLDEGEGLGIEEQITPAGGLELVEVREAIDVEVVDESFGGLVAVEQGEGRAGRYGVLVPGPAHEEGPYQGGLAGPEVSLQTDAEAELRDLGQAGGEVGRVVEGARFVGEGLQRPLPAEDVPSGPGARAARYLYSMLRIS
jgi:hypothetical protein